MKHTLRFALSALSIGLLSACGGGSSETSSNTNTTSVSGQVADGYLQGATVCLDLNLNSVCDVNEPSAVTGENGRYTLDDVNLDDADSLPILVEVPETAIDEDTMSAVGQAYMLSAPAGIHAFVSPLTTMLQQQMQNSGEDMATAMQSIQQQLNLTVDLTQDYIAMAQTTTGDAQLEYQAAHSAAQAMVRNMQANLASLGAIAAEQKAAVMQQLVTMARQTVAASQTMLDGNYGIETPNTLEATVASVVNSTGAATQAVNVQFDLMHNGASVRCGEAINLINTDNQVDPSDSQDTTGQLVDARFFVSNLMLTKADGSATPVYLTPNANQYQNVALLDFGYNTASSGVECTTTYNMNINGMVAPGQYTGVQMTVGVPIRSADLATKLNHTDRTFDADRAAITASGMNWSWQGGRKFVKVEFMPNDPIEKPDGSTTPKWNVHIGSTGCIGDPTIAGNETTCTNANRLDLNFSEFDSQTQKVAFDVGTLFAKSDVTYEGGGAVGCMSATNDPECPAIFQQFGLSLEKGQSLTGDQAQSVFSVIAK
ncbi:MbnP family copper-binding protein [Thiomicrorhabdus indica]|uniref:MbnP family copper-binding protein n=1 Tax=Thiomicrorhabdus indica TaxID=2267253 RepID=UPI00102DFE6A|nr:MbnP family copper-binding protein [Thiomicrorhabdus indica]